MDREHPQWMALELLDHFVRDQMGECDSIIRVLAHLEQQRQLRRDSLKRYELTSVKLM